MSDEKPYLVFRLCSEKCLRCSQCGYVWGPGQAEEKRGKRPYWVSEAKR